MCVKSQEGLSLLHIINRSPWLSHISEITLFMPTLYEYGCCVVLSGALLSLISVPTVERDSSKLDPPQRHPEKGGGVG